jgi:hypothetical protein
LPLILGAIGLAVVLLGLGVRALILGVSEHLEADDLPSTGRAQLPHETRYVAKAPRSASPAGAEPPGAAATLPGLDHGRHARKLPRPWKLAVRG